MIVEIQRYNKASIRFGKGFQEDESQKGEYKKKTKGARSISERAQENNTQKNELAPTHLSKAMKRGERKKEKGKKKLETMKPFRNPNEH